MNPAGPPADMGGLIERVQELARGMGAREIDAAGPADLAAYRERLAGGGGKISPVVTAADTAVELGPPARVSLSLLLWTRRRGTARDGRAAVVGPDLSPGPRERDFAQVIMLGLRPDAEVNPFRLGPVPHTGERLPGVMARMVPGRLWLRVSRAAVGAGIEFAHLAGAARESWREIWGPETAVEVLFVSGDRGRVESLAGIAAEAKIMAGAHKKVALSAAGDYECEQLDCEACDEKPVCDVVREAVVIRRKMSR